MIANISEARLNDLCYLTLKKFFFEGMDMSPRGCDIRVCMNLAAPGTLLSLENPMMAAILLPNEVPPSSHEKFHDVDTDKVFEVCVKYMEDHWLKQTIEEAFGSETVRTEMLEFYSGIVDAVMGIPEDQCAVVEEVAKDK